MKSEYGAVLKHTEYSTTMTTTMMMMLLPLPCKDIYIHVFNKFSAKAQNHSGIKRSYIAFELLDI